MRPSLSAAVILSALFVGGPARAENACVDAYEKAQELRLQKKLVSARAELRICADPACPAATKKDCSRWLRELEQQLPTIVVVARDPNGIDLAGARVTIDGAPLAAGAGATPVDPGPHRVRCEREGSLPASLDVLIREGEENRILGCVLAPEPPREPPARRIPVAAVVTAAVSAVALGVWAGFGISGIEDRRHLRDTCYPRCAPAAVASVRTKLYVADAALGTGVAGLGAAVALFLLQKPAGEPARAALTASPLPGGAVLALSGAF